MTRKIVLLSDGTGNSAAQLWKTNVWRVFERLDLSADDQVAFYDDGVGTASFKPAAILGGAFGIGLKRNLIALYMFACRNYRSPDDEIFAFGFSRGAFTVRLLVGLIMEEGLAKADNEQDLYEAALAAYHRFREKKFRTVWPEPLRPERIANRVASLFARKRSFHYRRNVKVRFVGIWDTVGAYGMPAEELAKGISDYLWPWMFTDRKLHPDVTRGCHALSIDDDRTTFHPILWDETNETTGKGIQNLCEERISQVWFAGAHANVGGGYPDDSLAQISLDWMIREAVAQGLRFKTSAHASPQTVYYPGLARDKDGRMYDPRSGLGGYYRYGPRDVQAILQRHGCGASHGRPAKIHVSALERIKNGAHAYAPLGLPSSYNIVDATGQVQPLHASRFENPQQAQARHNSQLHVNELVFWRQCLFFLTVLVTAVLTLYPWLITTRAVDEFKHPLRWISDIVRAIGSFLPNALGAWVDAYARSPALFALLVMLASASLWWSARLHKRIGSWMQLTWRQSLAGALQDPGTPSGLMHSLRNNLIVSKASTLARTRIVPALFAFGLVYVVAAWTSHFLFNMIDTAGFVCTESKKSLQTLARGEIVLANGQTAKLDDLRRKAAERDQTLTEKDLKDPFKFVQHLPVFETSNICQSMQIKLERYQRVRIRFENTNGFVDGTIAASDPFTSLGVPGFRRKVLLLLGLPLRRELFRPWFRVVSRIGSTGGEENFLVGDDSDPQGKINETTRATRDGELFLFVNDAVLPLPGLMDLFYRNNKGKSRILIEGK